MIINAKNLILGRLATFVAKKALLGEKISIINSEQAVVVGSKKEILANYKRKRDRGAPLIGPFFPRQPDRFVKRAIRGMLPYKLPRGRIAFENIKCYVGKPEEFKENSESINNADVEKITKTSYLTIKSICKFLGGKV
ncbi:50S ribosomal protein L13 [Candidatus Woesearchaeota archaeon]|jgi:large subunit ribosomal protein L13|nr:50S ribosomal protein L13 [Candidatus Woesearchaeota archaeon]|tara:strand:- start:177 stop:590 length:414 start_codon:yes stop_codon:yes gene_type:complete